ncbi:flagellar motor protein MotB [Thiomicrospira aerophila AL3]|uniref:Flagellar motor protein MotB n=1 Tax=Thiomicrospira aerophila AL3 TaxID=717772 RepID=W0DPM7_9GAMM|nr:OmpA family protein [Thiomicrospira aerophila]AHF00417.1 flagellar motor protein MotB [Thiomicrospira aerophila AL3]
MKLKLTGVAIASLLAMSMNAHSGDIHHNGSPAYVINSEGNIVRTTWGGCVRSIHWSKETAIAKCEGWEEQVADKGASVAPAPAPAPAPVAVSSAPEKIVGLFSFDRADLDSKDFERLERFAAFLNANPNERAVVHGHTCTIGTPAYNLALSERRANAAKAYLLNQGVPADRIETVAFGLTQPAASNDTEAGRIQNRRFELMLAE